MTVARATRTFGVRLPIVILSAVGVFAAGIVLGLNLPFGAKPLTVTRGTAYLGGHPGTGTFQADHGGVTVLLPDELPWADANGNGEIGSAPSCLRNETSGSGAPVEAGYTQVRTPNGTSFYIVGWIRCL